MNWSYFCLGFLFLTACGVVNSGPVFIVDNAENFSYTISGEDCTYPHACSSTFAGHISFLVDIRDSDGIIIAKQAVKGTAPPYPEYKGPAQLDDYYFVIEMPSQEVNVFPLDCSGWWFWKSCDYAQAFSNEN